MFEIFFDVISHFLDSLTSIKRNEESENYCSEGLKLLKEDKTILEDLIVAAHNNAKAQLKNKTNEEISKATGGLGIPGFKWPL